MYLYLEKDDLDFPTGINSSILVHDTFITKLFFCPIQICYQTDKFHFRYKYAAEDSDSTSQDIKTSVNDNGSDANKMETNSTQPKIVSLNTTKQRSIQVTLVFQDKTYSRTGTVLAQIREQLLKDMLVDRADDVAAIPIQFYYSKSK